MKQVQTFKYILNMRLNKIFFNFRVLDKKTMDSFNSLKTFTKALQFGAYKHRNQRRKDESSPYINHPIEVANILSQAGVTDYQILSAAILHDTVEDTQTTPEELQKQFGGRIKNLVLECSDNKQLSKVDRKIYQIEKAKKTSSDAKLIKIADKISNCRDTCKSAPVGWTQQRVHGYNLWAFAVCRNLKGGNQILDHQIDELFKNAGVNSYSAEVEKSKLQQYYQILQNSKGQK